MIPARAAPPGWKKPNAPQGQGSWGGQSGQSWATGSVVAPRASPFGSGTTLPAAAGLQKKQEEAAKRQEELKARREKEEQKRAQQQAALVVKKVIQRLRVVGPDKFSAVVEELEKVQEEQAEAMGDLVNDVSAEAQKALEIAEKRFKAAEEKKLAEEQKKIEAEKAAEEKKAEEERKAQEEKEKLETLVAEAETAFEEAETSAAQVEEAAKTFTEGVAEASPQEILDAAKATEEAAAESKPVLEKVMVTLKEKRNEVSKLKIPKQEEIAKLADLNKKIIAFQKTLTSLREAAKEASKTANVKASAMKKEQAQKDAFASADKDGDGLLGVAEILAFAKSEYGFALAGAAKEKILDKLTKKDGGVPYQHFQQLRAMVTIEKSIVAAREKRAKEELIEKARQEKKAAIVSKVEPISKALEEAEAALQNAKKAAKGLPSSVTPATKQELTSSQIFEITGAVQEQADVCQAKLDSGEDALKKIANAEEDAADEVLAKFRKVETEKLQTRSKNMKTALSKTVAQLREAKEKASRKQYSEMEKLRLLVTPCILQLLAAESKTSESLFTSAGGKDEGMAKQDFIALVKSLSEKLPAESVPEPLKNDALEESKVETLFSHVADEKETIVQERFSMLMTRQFYRVSKTTVLSEEIGMEAKQVRKLELGETLEALEAPKLAEDSKLTRVKCRSLKDDKEGWVTLAGNKGSVFLEGVGHFLTCTKETPLTEELSVLSSKTVRKTAKGEHFQVLEFDKKDASVNLMRMKVLAMRDKIVGWVTIASSEGAKFFEPC
mmetsp:Transcript_44541/g.83579  ORF Transcript_44541/g.83579 Transcript_44541/m.83579 type:complete len:782 (-) Transcript_44541:119-2464(-)